MKPVVMFATTPGWKGEKVEVVEREECEKGKLPITELANDFDGIFISVTEKVWRKSLDTGERIFDILLRLAEQGIFGGSEPEPEPEPKPEPDTIVWQMGGWYTPRLSHRGTREWFFNGAVVKPTAEAVWLDHRPQ